VELTTARTILRPLGPGDVPAIHALWTDAGVRKYLWDDVVIPVERAAEVVAASTTDFAERRFGLWAVHQRASGDFLGFCGLRLTSEGETELLYGFYPRYWGQGFATETARAVLAYAFETLECTEVVAATDVPNEASQRVLGRIMHFERRGLLNGLDTVFYRVTRAQFR
jgi:[ribosomal protein S5]-alanine N-acetyltransferase